MVQIGQSMLHWADVLQMSVAAALLVAVLGSWLSVSAFLQLGHFHLLLASAGVCIVLPPQGGWLPSFRGSVRRRVSLAIHTLISLSIHRSDDAATHVCRGRSERAGAVR